MSGRRRQGEAAVWLVVLTAAVFWPSLRAGFVSDDGYLSLYWAVEGGVDWARVGADFIGPWNGTVGHHVYRPMVTLLGAMDLALWGDRGPGWHVTNLMLHLVAVVCVWGVAKRLFGAPTALVAGLLFALHPARVESATWIMGRTSGLAAALSFACVWAWVSGRRRGALVWLAAACLAKESALALPAALVCLDMVKPDSPVDGVRGAVRRVFPAFAVVGAVLMLRWVTLGTAVAVPPGGAWTDAASGLLDRAVAAFHPFQFGWGTSGAGMSVLGWAAPVLLLGWVGRNWRGGVWLLGAAVCLTLPTATLGVTAHGGGRHLALAGLPVALLAGRGLVLLAGGLARGAGASPRAALTGVAALLVVLPWGLDVRSQQEGWVAAGRLTAAVRRSLADWLDREPDRILAVSSFRVHEGGLVAVNVNGLHAWAAPPFGPVARGGPLRMVTLNGLWLEGVSYYEEVAGDRRPLAAVMADDRFKVVAWNDAQRAFEAVSMAIPDSLMGDPDRGPGRWALLAGEVVARGTAEGQRRMGTWQAQYGPSSWVEWEGSGPPRVVDGP